MRKKKLKNERIIFRKREEEEELIHFSLEQQGGLVCPNK